ncbi:hypothetical protein Salat_2041300 [Sesamum alatum]|uniref:Uncharacterized protein n=1 Tax=Sesamum alatum TaxID=300844 RepID=A0AAE1XZG9_9LAMI|nr:hypothetical protein Salat_2041300 [Sesamum alatum]
MASVAKLLCCLLFIVLCTGWQTEARESKFFAKYVHLSTVPEQDVSLSSPSPAPAPITSQISDVPASSPLVADYVPVPAPAPLMADYVPVPAPTPLMADYVPIPAPAADQGPLEPGFGYAPAPLESEKTTVVDNEDEEFSDEEFSIESPGKRESNTYSNGYSSNLSNNNGFWTSNYKGYNTNGYDYKSEPQGMSDTRVVNNGVYYYDVEPENDGRKGYGLVRESKNEEGYYYGNKERSKYEFDSMEEYEKQEGYPDPGFGQDFIP